MYCGLTEFHPVVTFLLKKTGLRCYVFILLFSCIASLGIYTRIGLWYVVHVQTDFREKAKKEKEVKGMGRKEKVEEKEKKRY